MVEFKGGRSKTLYLRLPEIPCANLAKMNGMVMGGANSRRGVDMAAADREAGELGDALGKALGQSLPKSDTVVVEKYNHDHDERGRFSSGSGGGTSGNGEKAKPVQVASNDVNRATDASPEGSGPDSDPEKDPPWKNKPDANLRDYIGSQEVSSEAGYETNAIDTDKNGKPILGSNHAALGRYQMRNSTLQDAGWKDEKGNWTEKAKNAGVSSDGDFLAKPEAQEAAMTDVLDRKSKELRSNGADKYVGQTIKNSKGEDLPITSDGLLAAAHREGARHVKEYLNPNEREHLNSNVISHIETRLRQKRR